MSSAEIRASHRFRGGADHLQLIGPAPPVHRDQVPRPPAHVLHPALHTAEAGDHPAAAAARGSHRQQRFAGEARRLPARGFATTQPVGERLGGFAHLAPVHRRDEHQRIGCQHTGVQRLEPVLHLAAMLLQARTPAVLALLTHPDVEVGESRLFCARTRHAQPRDGCCGARCRQPIAVRAGADDDDVHDASFKDAVPHGSPQRRGERRVLPETLCDLCVSAVSFRRVGILPRTYIPRPNEIPSVRATPTT